MAEEDPISLWKDDRTKYIVDRILATYPKLSAGDKFDKLFCTENNR